MNNIILSIVNNLLDILIVISSLFDKFVANVNESKLINNGDIRDQTTAEDPKSTKPLPPTT